MEKHLQIQTISKTQGTEKGQKLVAALYLITNHLSDTDPLKAALRAKAVELIEVHDRVKVVEHVTNLLWSAVFAHLVSEKNATIITRELKLFAGSEQEDIVTLLVQQPSISRTNIMSNIMSLKPKNVFKNEVNKTNRKEKIISYINEKKSVAIKDISALFPDVSEKTIQRELGALVAAGKIRKHGSKRWSLYLALNQ